MPGASIPLVETLNPPGFALDSASDHSHRDAHPLQRPPCRRTRETAVAPCVYPSFIHMPQVYPSQFVFCWWVFSHPVSLLPSRDVKGFVFLACFLWKQSLHGPLASRWVMGPLGITFGPIASFTVGHLNLWVSTKMPFRRAVRKPEWCLRNVCKTDR